VKISEALSKFLLGRRADGIAPSTVEWYRKRLARFIEFFNDCEFITITIDDLRRLVVSLQEQNVKWANHKFHHPTAGNLSPSTIHGYVRIVKTFYNWLEQNDYITTAQNVAIRLKKPKLPKQAPKEILEMDMISLIEAAKSYGRYSKRNYAMILFLADTGCRVGGLASLRLADLDLSRGQAMVIEKGSKSRIVFFGQETKDALTAWLAERPQDIDTGFLFVSERGRLTTYGVRMVLKRLKKIAGVGGFVNPHSFRHAFAKRAINHGISDSSLANLMGHTNIKTTHDAYLIYRTQELQDAHRRYSSLGGHLKK
jgi:integrase/recombinase XerD